MHFENGKFDEFKIGHREWINLKDILDVEYYYRGR